METNKFTTMVFQFGRKVSMAIEAGVIGFLPLILFVLEVVSAWSEASLVSQVMPYFEGTFWKAIIYTGAGMGAGIFFAPNISWYIQVSKFHKKLLSNKVLPMALKEEIEDNLLGAKARFLWTSIFTVIVAVGSHAVTIYFMLTAFNNTDTLKLLDIRGMGEVPMTLAIAVSVMGLALDILLGLTTSTKLKLTDFYPDIEERSEDIVYAEKYTKVEELMKKYEIPNGKKKEKESSKKESKEDEKESTKDGDKDTYIWEESSMDKFYSTVLNKGGITIDSINKAIDDLSDQEYSSKYASKISENFTKLKHLYKSKHEAGDQEGKAAIQEKINDLKLVALKIFRDMGLRPRKGSK